VVLVGLRDGSLIQHDHIVLTLNHLTQGDIFRGDEKLVGVGVFGDLGRTPLDEADAGFASPVVKLFVTLGGGADIDIVDRNFGPGMHLLDEERVLDGVHAAEIGTAWVVALITRANTVDDGDVFWLFTVAGADQGAVSRSGGVIETFHFHRRDHVREASVAVFGHWSGVKMPETSCHDDGANFLLFEFIFHAGTLPHVRLPTSP